MNATDPRDRRSPPPDDPPADEEYARAYATGYEEGVRNALREIVQHASRGHTSQELRMLAESRLSRLSEEAEVKRRGLLGPPRRSAWGTMLKPTSSLEPPRPRPVALPSLSRGQSLLVREERPARALELLAVSRPVCPRTVVVSLHPPPPSPGAPGDRVDLVPTRAGDAAPGAGGLSELGGRLRQPTESPGGALVYMDCLEYFVAEEGAETAIRFAHWLVGQVKATGSALVVSFDTRSLDVKDASRLERAFQQVA